VFTESKLVASYADAHIGEARALFALDSDAHRMHLDHYFSERENTETAWVHELGMRRYGKVAKMLLNVADDADELAEKHVSDTCCRCWINF
jgi:antirestriction protein ArdC